MSSSLAETVLEYDLFYKLRKKRQEAERTYKDFKCNTLESGKIEKLKVKELDFYLEEHGLTTVGWKLNK